jgi:hypothetical protein
MKMVGWGLALLHWTRLERIARDKHFSSLQTLVIYYRKEFYTIKTWNQYLKNFYGRNLRMFIIS